MQPVLVIVLLIALLSVGYSVVRALFRSWVDHRVRVVLLTHFEENPDLVESSDEVRRLAESVRTGGIHNHTLTGGFLTIIGIGCIVGGQVLGVGQLAVGIHVGGYLCVGIGLLMALAGILIRAITRTS